MIAVVCLNVNGQTVVLPSVKAFLTANGYGRNATGGRGGVIIPVTNNNDAGPGSLRAALIDSRTRIITFRVSGTINLSNYINVGNDNFTIAGETAPGQGIQIDGSGGIQITASNWIIRHIRFRGSNVISNLRVITSNGVVEDGIIDHCSFSWPDPDEMNISIEATSANGNVQARDITVQNCILGEATRGMLLYKGHYRISIYRNYFANTQQRCINANRPLWIPDGELSFEEINCIAHNTQIEMIQASYGTKFTAIGNKRTNASGSYTSSAKTIVDVYTLPGEDGDWADTYIYENDNLNTLSGGSIYDGSTAGYIFGSRYASSDITGDLILPVADIDDMLSTLGAFYWNRDAVDTRYINDYLNNTGSIGTYSGTPPALSSGSNYPDADSDGMDDDWETLHSVTTRDQVNSSYVIDGITYNNAAGWTAMDIFLAERASDFDNLPGDPVGGSAPTFTNSGYEVYNVMVGSTYTPPTVTAYDADDGDITDDIVITGTVNTSVVGTYYVYYDVSDSDSNSIQLVITVNVLPIPVPGKGKWINSNVLFTLD